MESTKFRFIAFDGRKRVCPITIYRSVHIILVNQTGPGVQVTKVASQIATQVVNHWGLAPSRMLYLERCLQPQWNGTQEEEYYLVTFTWKEGLATDPDWQYLSTTVVNQILDSVGDSERKRSLLTRIRAFLKLHFRANRPST